MRYDMEVKLGVTQASHSLVYGKQRVDIDVVMVR